MIIITGAAGFIGSICAKTLNEKGYQDLVLVDDFTREDKRQNWEHLTYTHKVDRETVFTWLEGKQQLVQAIVHLGARTDTTEQDWEIFQRLNLDYSKALWKLASQYQIPLIYASSAATYGDGSLGFIDDESTMPALKPLNPYGKSKQLFDEWVLAQAEKPFFWAGLKFFNVYGPHENHKGRMASVVFHAFHQIQKTGKMKLFKSHNDKWENGKQLRDFIYVKDIAAVVVWLLEERKRSGIYNLGTGQARTFLDLVQNVFKAMNIPANIEFIDIPEDIREAYQYFTEASMQKLRESGYVAPFTSLEQGIEEYVADYLQNR
ncbi:MAG: ADP-glyceromanno-heptose 6-epimerase [Bacteroidia bacterium]